MATNIFISKEILKLQKESEVNKKEVCLILELITYLVATNQMSLQDATKHTELLFKLSP